MVREARPGGCASPFFLPGASTSKSSEDLSRRGGDSRSTEGGAEDRRGAGVGEGRSQVVVHLESTAGEDLEDSLSEPLKLSLCAGVVQTSRFDQHGFVEDPDIPDPGIARQHRGSQAHRMLFP